MINFFNRLGTGLADIWTNLQDPDSYAWMAWTWQVALFFCAIATLLVIFTLLAVYKPETPRIGILTIPTTRGDRLFISLLGSAFIHVLWLALAPANLDLWWASLLCLFYAVGVFLLV
jgi:predicted small integral membrane protein